jgi:putative membrane protein
VTGREPRALLAVGAVLLVVSGIAPRDRLPWALEVVPILIAAAILVATAHRFPLTPLAYRLIFVHALILIRRSPLRPGRWLTVLVLCVCLAVSAAYELVEWWTAAIGGHAADAFLGTEGDQWDTQWDMFTALLGAATALVLLSRVHLRQIRRLEETSHV